MGEIKKVIVVMGTRPEAIKMAPVIKKLETATGFNTLTCVTAQHRELLDQVLDIFQIKPDFDLDLMKKGQDLFDITTKVLLGLQTIFAEAKPDLIMVHGDTTTSSMAALAAFYCKIRVATHCF
jgi:UDP-N-acetylglucosamine 2-epimerase (non-hydrolysing)